MSTQALIGAALLASPFVMLTVVGVIEIGWRDVAKGWGLALLVAGAVSGGGYLIATSYH